MGTIALILALVLVFLLAASLYLWLSRRRKPSLTGSLTFIKPTHRKLTLEERAAIEYYLNQQDSWSENKLLPNIPTPNSAKLTLTVQSDDVYPITQAITRYGLANDTPNNWRYYLDSEEIHLPPFWEQYISADNYVEVIKTQTLPLVISLNGYSLLDHIQNSSPPPVVTVNHSENAAIRKDESEHVELINIRKETREEYTLNGPNGVKEAITISVALLLLFFSLISPVVVIPWMIFSAVLTIVWGCWSLFRRPVEGELKEVHGLRGTPKRWELFGESNQEQVSNISLGTIDLIYPPHWQPYLSQDLGKITNVDIYLNKQVIRHGHYLSLHDEVKNFPLQKWGKNAVLAANSLVVLLLLLTYIPLSLPVKLSSSWLQGTKRTEVSNVQELNTLPLHIGDTLKIHGTGMCYVPSNNHPTAAVPSFMPFDCSTIYWSNADPLPQPESEIVNKATALRASVNGQLHRSGNEQKLNPQLASAIEKSGMILLDDFSGIVLKTQDLCGKEADCIRLKNALTNLGNAKNWTSLVKRAKSGALRGINVLLRPISAKSLENLTNAATSAFFSQETLQAIARLNNPPSGGFLITSDEGKLLVNHQLPLQPLNEYNTFDQWKELQRLSRALLNTPFKAQGVITNTFVDANGTRHIALHSEPDMVTLWRYLGTSLLLLALVIIFGYNTWRLIQRWRKNQHRLADIHRYYQSCFNPQLTPVSISPAV
ncbi:IgaA/UmoB family intracellular growth attenuator [Serratia sp. UGAL515B_01]|uniref:IgaA/UmoB family intracellular growth attenuator n=1 Tax=Serratia sp. UGAL515B_01 TaxID=2986763 RepID=UPI0029539763|nr:IgaA/UmoB family intracellular growth attenuator [Serratia sp. UGAL515B_01]WON76747.1 intracellular growth attenuator family protein [Serratia sp. UGAL515B_01]